MSASATHAARWAGVSNGKSETIYGIYKIEGDTLTICFNESEKPEDRPKEFKTSKDDRARLLTLKRKS